MSNEQKIVVKPFGDRKNDGAIQLSFTLPVSLELAHQAAIEFCRKMNLQEIEIVNLQSLLPAITYVQAFAKAPFGVEISESALVVKTIPSREEILAKTSKWQKPLTIVGACTGTDAHTVGLDAILNKKGYKGDKGLESYSCFEVINLGSQVKNRELIEQIKIHKAEVLLVSQIITQQNVHIHNLTELIDMLEAVGLRSNLQCIIGGPRITHQLALELGFDAGFGASTRPQEVADFIVDNKLTQA